MKRKQIIKKGRTYHVWFVGGRWRGVKNGISKTYQTGLRRNMEPPSPEYIYFD